MLETQEYPSKARMRRHVRAATAAAVLAIVATVVPPATAASQAEAQSPLGRTVLVSVAEDGTTPVEPPDPYGPGHGYPRLSADGRFVVWVTNANGLVPGDHDGLSDVYVKDLASGTVERITVREDGKEANNIHGVNPGQWQFVEISDDGRYVLFQSMASDLVPGDENHSLDAFVKDRWTGRIERVNVRDDETELPDGIFRFTSPPMMSGDGRFVVFAARFGHVTPPKTVQCQTQFGYVERGIYGQQAIWVRDRQQGTTSLIQYLGSNLGDLTSCRDLEGKRPDVVHLASFWDLSGDGRTLAYSTQSPLIPEDQNGLDDVYVRDLDTGVTELVSRTWDDRIPNNSPCGYACLGSFFFPPGLSHDGSVVAFSSWVPDLVPWKSTAHRGDPFGPDNVGTNGEMWAWAYGKVLRTSWSAVYVRDRDAGTTERVSVSSSGDDRGLQQLCCLSISADGRFVSFMADPSSGLAPPLPLHDENVEFTPLVHDRLTGQTDWVAVTVGGRLAGSMFTPVSMSGDGRVLAFSSFDELTDEDENRDLDVYVRDRGAAPGPAGLTASISVGRIEVNGWTHTGGPLLSRPDPTDDVEQGGRPLGAELTGFQVTNRPERGDLLFQIGVAEFPGPSTRCTGRAEPRTGYTTATGAGKMCVSSLGSVPGVTYAITIDDGEFAVLIGRPGPVEPDPDDVQGEPTYPVSRPYFGLYSVNGGIYSRIQDLEGGIGSTTNEVTVAVPLAAFGSSVPGEAAVAAWAGDPRNPSPASATAVFDVVGPAAEIIIPDVEVRLGIAPAGTPEGEVSFTTSASWGAERFSGELDASSLPPGGYDVWARVCSVGECDASSTRVVV
jgi:hypothetical protein